MGRGGRREKTSVTPDSDFVKRQLKFSLECQAMPKIDLSDGVAVKERIDWYFRRCMEDGYRPGVEGLCVALHTNRGTIAKWTTGQRRAGQEQQEAVLDAKQILADLMEQYMMNGEINPVAGIFLASNNFGYDRNATVTVQTQPQIISTDDPARLADKYRADAIDVEATPAPLRLSDHETEE